MKRGKLIILFLAMLFIPGATAYADQLIFSDDFEGGVLDSNKWISGSGGGDPNTITVTGGRVQATANSNFIETVQEFSGDFRLEMDVEKVGDSDHSCWDFMVELRAFGGTSGVIRFDYDGIDGIGIGDTCSEGYFPLDGNSINKGKAIFTYSNSYLLFSFINDDGDVLHAAGKYVGEYGSGKIRIYLAAHADSPRYVDNVKIYSIAQNQAWRRNLSNDHFYRLIDQAVWGTAEGQANGWGVHLVSINYAEEDLWLQSEFGTTDYFWIGFNDIAEEGTWVWTGGEPATYTNWCPGEPTNGAGEDAAILDTSGCWQDIDVTNSFTAILEYAASPNYTGSEPVFQGFIHNVHEPNGDSKTYIEVIFGDDFSGYLPDDITTITVKDPNGVVLAEYPGPNWTYSPQWRDFWTQLDGSPPVPGVYTFTVTGDGFAEVDTDHQYNIRTIPTPDTNSFVPSNSATVFSKTPSFSWDPVDLPGVPLYYRLIIDDGTNRVYATNRVFGMTSHTVPEGILNPDQAYYWRIRVTDASDYDLLQNRANSANESADPVTGKLSFTMAPSLVHNNKPFIFPDDWTTSTYSRESGNATICWIRINDHDGVASDGSSHQVEVTLPGGGGTHAMVHDRTDGPNVVAYSYWSDAPPQSGTYTFRVTDPDGNVGTLVENFNYGPLPLPDESFITPNVRNERITATFDNIYVRKDGALELYEDFNSYSSIDNIDRDKWDWQDNASIQRDNGNGWLVLDISNSVGRANGTLTFADPQSINQIQADVTVTDINEIEGKPRARIRGSWCNNGIGDIGASLSLNGSRVYWSADEEFINEQRTWQWTDGQSGDLLTGLGVGDSVTLSISWDGTALTFSATGPSGSNSYTYTPTDNFGPPIYPDKQIQTRIDLPTHTTPSFSWNPVTGAERYRFRIYNFDNSQTIWSGYPGGTSVTVPPGILNPNALYRFRLEAWDAHSPMSVNHALLNVDNVSITPASNDDNYIFYTGSHVEEDDHPFIELTSNGVNTWNSELGGPSLEFWIRVHDAQGVPDNIDSVKVIHPGGAEEFLEYSGDNPYSPATPTSANYSLTSSQPPADDQIYTFIVADNDGNLFQTTEKLSVKAIGFPDTTSLSPPDDSLISGTGVFFNWEDVQEVGFYSVNIFDYDFNRIYTFHTTASQLLLSSGFLKEDTLYRYRIFTRREFWDQNVDNMSGSPENFSDAITFTTSSPSVEDTDGDGMPDAWEEFYGLNPAVDDADGDLDDDGLSNIMEYKSGTYPDNQDTDGDTYKDGNDAFPLDSNEWADKDNDGIGDNSDPDNDNDEVDDADDNCPVIYNPEQEDIDEDTMGDACDNCPKVANPAQEDSDEDGMGNACEPGDGFKEALTVVDTLPQQPGEPVPKQPGEPLWVTATFENNSPEPIETIKPDCFNTSFQVKDVYGKILPPRYRIRAAYGIPKDVVTLPPGPFSVTCNLADMFAPEVLKDPIPADGKPEPYTVVATYSNDIQDPDLNPVTGACAVEPCIELFVGAVSSPEATVKIEGTSIEIKTANFTIDPKEWNPQWAVVGGPIMTVSLTIKDAGGELIPAGTVDPASIRLNGMVEIIAGSDRIEKGTTLKVQFDGSTVINSVGSVVPGPSFITIQGNFKTGENIFSGQGPVYILYPIDIKPDTYPNTINLKSKETVPVAILSTPDFDATTVDPATVKLAGAPVKMKKRKKPMASFEDVNKDGYRDLVVHFDTKKLKLKKDSTVAYLTGKTIGETPADSTDIKGVDSVKIDKKKEKKEKKK